MSEEQKDRIREAEIMRLDKRAEHDKKRWEKEERIGYREGGPESGF